jgi:hypothetical protein
MNMKKAITSILAACMALSMAACSAKTDSSDATAASSSASEQVAKSAEPKDIEAAIANVLGSDYLATVEISQDDLYLSAMSEFDMSKVASYVAKQSEIPSVDQDTVVIVKLNDKAYADEAVKLLNDSFSQIVNYTHQYPFNVAKVENGRIYKADDLVMFIIAGKSQTEDISDEQAKQNAADGYAKVDEAIKSLIGVIPENLAVVNAGAPDGGNGDKPILGG